MSPPDDQMYMKIRATSHLIINGGNRTSYSNINNNIIGFSGHNIPVIGCENVIVPNPHHYQTLKNILHAPELIKNLVSIRKFTINNDISAECDSFVFSIKDFSNGNSYVIT